MKTIHNYQKYFTEALNKAGLSGTTSQCSIVSVELDDAIVHDFIIFLPKNKFSDFFEKFSNSNFVLNDQSSSPHVFTRFKSYGWLKDDFKRRLPIALWIFSNSQIVRDDNNRFRKTVDLYKKIFQQNIREITKQKYIELRSDRHNLRHAIFHGDKVAANILRGNISKLALEISILCHKKPYPYKKLLVSEAKKFDENELISLINNFLKESKNLIIIDLSERIIQLLIKKIKNSYDFKNEFLERWWENLM